MKEEKKKVLQKLFAISVVLGRRSVNVRKLLSKYFQFKR